MNEAWLDQWLSNDASVLRRSKADVAKSPGGGNATTAELLSYLNGRSDAPLPCLRCTTTTCWCEGMRCRLSPYTTVSQISYDCRHNSMSPNKPRQRAAFGRR